MGLWRFVQPGLQRSTRPSEGAIGHSVARKLRIIGWVIDQIFAPTRAQQVELALEAVSLVRPIVPAAAHRLRMDEARMGSEDDALAGFAEPQAIIDVVESNTEMGLVHSAHLQIVGTAGDEAGGGDCAAFVGYAKQIEVTHVVEQPVPKGMHRAGLRS